MSSHGFFFFNAPPPPEIYTLSLHAALPISMTKEERANPDLLKHSRKQRIAKGSGTNAADINKLLKMHRQMADMMKMMGGKGKGGLMQKMMGGIGAKLGFGGLGGGLPDLSSMDPKQLEKIQKQAESAGLGNKLPGLGGGTLPGLPSSGTKFQGLPGLPKKH